jgi:hypothetical protein
MKESICGPPRSAARRPRNPDYHCLDKCSSARWSSDRYEWSEISIRTRYMQGRGQRLAKTLGAVKFVEGSGVNGDGVNNVFDEVIDRFSRLR